MADTPLLANPPPAPPPPGLPTGPPGRPTRLRYVLVVLLPVAAVAAVLLWYYSVERAVGLATDPFVGADVPGQVTLTAHPDTWYVYATRQTSVETIQVAGPDGRYLPVTASAAGTYMTGGRDYRAVGQFTVQPSQTGNVTVVLTGTEPGGNDARFAVGDFSINGFRQPQVWTMAGLLVVDFGAAVAIAVWPAVRGRRSRRRGKRSP